MKTTILITAAGRGIRAGGGMPKQYRQLGGRMVLRHTLEAFATHASDQAILAVIHPDDAELYQTAIGNFSGSLLAPVHGADTRQASILAGLRALRTHDPKYVLIHDAARPFPASTLITRVMKALRTHPAVLPATRVADTVKRVHDGIVAETVPREDLWLAQTPQGFHFKMILDAHEAAAKSGITSFTDDASIAEWAGFAVSIVEGHPDNIKLTTPHDFHRAEQLARDLTSDKGT